MSLLNKLTIKNLKLNKKRTVVTVIGIILSVALITAVSSMYNSGISSLIKFEIREKGNFHYAYYDVPVSELKNFKNNRKIEAMYYIKQLGYAKLKESKNQDKPYAHLMSFNSDSLKNLSIKLVEGRLPKNEDEIIIPTHLKTNGRVSLKVGDNITLDVGTRVDNNNQVIKDNPYIEGEEKIIDTTKKTYKIVGIIERPASNIEDYSAPGYTFITYMKDKVDGSVDLYTRYTKEGLKDRYTVTADILGVDAKLFKKYNSSDILSEDDYNTLEKEMNRAKYEVNTNNYLMDLEINPLNNNTTGSLSFVVLVVCLIIIVTSVFCIKNSFDISITEKIKQYGMLRSVGATKNQIKKNVFYEAFILGLIGIPLGIILGILASYILIIVCNMLLEDFLAFGLNLEFELSWIAIIFSIILGIITIYLSAIRSAKKASKVSPIDSIRNSADIKIKGKKVKSPKIIKKIFGIGGDISYKNLKRNKRKYRTTVISIVVSVSIFIALSSFVSLAFMSVNEELKIQDYNVSLYISDNVGDNVYQKYINTTKLDNIEKYTILNHSSIVLDSNNYSKEYKEAIDIDNEEEPYVTIFAVGDRSYKEYLNKLGLDYNDTKNKAILIDTIRFGVYDEETDKIKNYNIRALAYKKGDTIKGMLSFDEKEFKIDIAMVTTEKPFGLKNYEGAIIIVSDEMYQNSIKDEMASSRTEILYKSNNPDKLQDDIEEYLKGYDVSVNNSNENVRMMRNLFTLIAIFLYGFIIVISLIGITNIFNTITTNMELRKQEFAMLKSIGMTKLEFKRMIRLESLFMGLKALLFGIPIGIILSYLIYRALSNDLISYPLPYQAIIISIIAVFLLITSLMRYSMNKINKQNTIETIRNENI